MQRVPRARPVCRAMWLAAVSGLALSCGQSGDGVEVQSFDVAVQLPARIEAEEYARAFDTDVGNRGGACRAGDVDLQLSGDSAGGECNVGWTRPGEWLEYDIVAMTAGSYELSLRVSSASAGQTGHIEIDGVNVATFDAPGSGWTTYSDRKVSASLTPGAHVLRVVFDTGAINFNYLDVRAPSAGPSLPSYCSSYPPPSRAGQWQSSIVRYNSAGRLTYTTDAADNRIPDFSYAGYHYGQAEPPLLPVVQTIGPVSGDNTANIQAALDQVGARTPDANGLRGTLRLLPGTYEIRGSLRLDRSGVVLRGAGDGSNAASNTILIARGDTPHQRTVVRVGTGDGSPWHNTAAATNVIADAKVSATSLRVASTAGLAAGNEILIRHPSTAAWIAAVDGGGLVNSADWTPGSTDIPYVRRIVRIVGDQIDLDAPIYNHLKRGLAQATVAKVTSRSLVNHVGVEDLRIDIETAGGVDENHAWTAISVVGAEDSWVRGVTALHFGKAGVETSGAIRITVTDTQALSPVAIVTGGRMYNFNAEANSQLILFTHCAATGGRHHFISNGTSSASGIVFHRCTSDGSSSEGHRRWSQALLFDSINATGGSILIGNRGDWGTSHGWGAVHSAIWNYTKGMAVQQPPTGQNYAVSRAGSRANPPWPGPAGHVEIQAGELVPESLYEAQLCDRLR